jgi:hypothetical protein
LLRGTAAVSGRGASTRIDDSMENTGDRAMFDERDPEGFTERAGAALGSGSAPS